MFRHDCRSDIISLIQLQTLGTSETDSNGQAETARERERERERERRATARAVNGR